MGNCCIKNKINPDVESTVLNWSASKKTEYYHWWPMCESNENDITNNNKKFPKFANIGLLAEYDESQKKLIKNMKQI